VLLFESLASFLTLERRPTSDCMRFSIVGMWHKNLSPNLKPVASTAPGLFAPLLLRHKHQALSIALSLFMLMTGASVGQGKSCSITQVRSPLPAFTRQEAQKRLVLLRHSDTAEGSRCTITSDSLLDDYRSYVEGERFFVRVPQATLFNGSHIKSGRGFKDMRVDEGEEDVIISFILQPGTSFNVNQNFNHLEINFLTNDEAKESASAR
jgi:hypothetical protein